MLTYDLDASMFIVGLNSFQSFLCPARDLTLLFWSAPAHNATCMRTPADPQSISLSRDLASEEDHIDQVG